jgi:hypothetical protein
MATAQVPPFTSFAQQDSSIDTTRIEASGSGETTGSGGFAAPPNNFIITDSEAASRFSATFAVASATPYRRTGSVTVTGGLSASALARIRLKTAGGAVVDEVSVQTDPECQFTECALVEEALHSIGVLAPGSYVLEAETSGTATPFFFAGNFFGLTSTGQYEVELTPTEVPALSRGALAALALGLGLAGAAAARRR